MSKRPQLQTQFIIFILFGDVIVHQGGRVWTSSLLQMLEVLGVSERAARSTLSRMRRKGWVKPERDGRHSAYTLTARGRRIIEEGGQRIFEPRHMAWSGAWYLVVYSLPENKRALRNDLRKRLSWLGFGRLAPGTWISPYDRHEEVEVLLSDLNAMAYAQRFSGLRLAAGTDRDVVAQCWDIKGLNQQYARFIARWEPDYLKATQTLNLSPAQCFAQRFWITQAYSPFPRLDPNLPPALLPEDWLGTRAAEIFNAYRQHLNEQSAQFIETVMDPANGHAA